MPDIQELRRRAYARAILPFVRERERLEGDLEEFVKAAWKSFDPSDYMENWAISALCEHLQAVTEGQIKRLLVNFPPRPISENAMVITERGILALREIVIGDSVLSHCGQWRRVNAVHRRGVLPLLRITTRGGREVETALDHPFLTPSGWVEAKDLVVDDVLAVVPNYSECGEKTILPEEARLLGYAVGDGACKTGLRITSADDLTSLDIADCAAKLGFRSREAVYKITKTGIS